MDEITIEAKIESLPEVLSFINEKIKDVPHSSRTQMHVEMISEEIYVNICQYAYGDDGGTATIGTELKEGDPATLIIRFCDTGTRFDPLKKEDPDITLPAGSRPIGGLGIFLVKKMIDDIDYKYEDSRNILTVTKVLK